MKNLKWLQSGKTGCTFATLFAKSPESVGWEFFDYQEFMVKNLFQIVTANIVCINFPSHFTKKDVENWAYKCGFYKEETSPTTYGLRIKCKEGISWVQYFGKDSHVKTRQSPEPMLMYCNKLNKNYYVKVGWKGILHLAHAYSEKYTKAVYDLLWERSFKQTEKLLGHKPTIIEASKTTFTYE